DLGAVLVLMFTFLVLAGGRIYHILLDSVHHGLVGLAHRVQHHVLPAIVAIIAFLLLLRLVQHSSGKLASTFKHRIDAFKSGFNTIQDLRALILVAVVSLATWYSIAEAYIQVLHSYPLTTYTLAQPDGSVETHTAKLGKMKLEDVLLLMGGSMFGSVLQLPGGVGGSQLAIVNLLSSSVFTVEPFNVTPELALSCGMMLWLVTFMTVIPAGLLFARSERISLRAVEDESESAEEEIEEKA
ncbi:MAG TPA: hypothetical protein VMT82_07780, partial [candidate division Zixibacteria bacterium]|nr:hypothetical protein [candidate division Zixibacteria bacterium]